MLELERLRARIVRVRQRNKMRKGRKKARLNLVKKVKYVLIKKARRQVVMRLKKKPRKKLRRNNMNTKQDLLESRWGFACPH